MTIQDIRTFTNEYYASLPNAEKSQPKCVILFSGVPGSGKSRVARAIEKEFNALRISNDDIRDRIAITNPTIMPEEREQIKLGVATELLCRMQESSNGRIVFDVSCDRPGGYDFYARWAQKYGYPVVLLRFDIPRSIIEQRIRERGDTGYRTVANSLANLDTWWQQWEAFGRKRKPDLVVKVDTPIDSILELLKTKHVQRNSQLLSIE